MVGQSCGIYCARCQARSPPIQYNELKHICAPLLKTLAVAVRRRMLALDIGVAQYSLGEGESERAVRRPVKQLAVQHSQNDKLKDRKRCRTMV